VQDVLLLQRAPALPTCYDEDEDEESVRVNWVRLISTSRNPTSEGSDSNGLVDDENQKHRRQTDGVLPSRSLF
jgi:hypothetical protein